MKTKYEDEGLLKHTEELLTELGPGKGIHYLKFSNLYNIHIRQINNGVTKHV